MLASLPRRVLVIAAFTTLVGCSTRALPATAPGTPENPLRIMATTSALPLVVEAAAAYDDPNLTLEVRSGNYRQAMEALRRGEVHFVVTTHLDSQDAAAFWAAPIAQDAIVFVVNPANSVEDVSLIQVRQAYQGRIINWQSLGGDSVAMQVVSRESGSGIRSEFEQSVMGRRVTTGAALTASSSLGVLRTVAAHPGALGYVSLAILDATVRPLAVDGVAPTLETLRDHTYPLRSTVFVVGKDEPQGGARGFIGWMQSQEGQAVLSRLYLPLVVTPGGD